MARPRVRRTTRNPNLKTRRKQKNPYDVSFNGAHPLVKENWNKKMTLKQNYERMGLLSALNGAAGGTQHGAEERRHEEEVLERQRVKLLEEDVEWRAIDDDESSTTTVTAAAVEEEEDDDDYDVDTQGPVRIDPRARRIGHKVGLKRSVDPAPVPASRAVHAHVVVAAMEEEANDVVRLVRHASEQEGRVFGDLMRKHGRDYEAMAKDMRLNKYQLSTGQIRKRIERLLQ
ncbi:hypothetical protein HKX48_001142 [Thoreauomyces humboldtii]|nr:hypothetical protein HKX48_001142 [Thoreauomyces humboldtii]